MKNLKIALSVILFVLMLIPFVSFAQGTPRGVHEPGTGIENPELKEAEQGTGQGKEAPVPTLYNEGEEGQQNGQMKQTKNQGKDQAVGKGFNQASDKGISRRSMVANAVQQMLQVAERNQGVGKQIRTIAQTQEKNINSLEDKMTKVQNRGRLKKFFLGPDYKNINSIEAMIVNHDQRLMELKELVPQITDEDDLKNIQEQIMIMENVSKELKNQTKDTTKGFSLFGWVYKMFTK